MHKLQIEKKKLLSLDSCYSIDSINTGKSNKIIAASEEKAPCFLIDLENNATSEIIKDFGGTMAFAIPSGPCHTFYAIRNFHPVFQADNAEIVKIIYDDYRKSWQIKSSIKLPFVHRIGLLKSNGKIFLIAATLCSAKEDVDDWSSPGAVWAAHLDKDFTPEAPLMKIMDNLYLNHGFCKLPLEHRTATNKLSQNIQEEDETVCDKVLITSQEGIHLLSPPDKKDLSWKTELLVDHPVSDAAVSDIDNDGNPEIGTIEPFHGGRFAIYKKTGAGYKPIWSFEKPELFGHVIWGGKIRNSPAFIFGYRAKDAGLFLVQKNRKNPEKFTITTIDSNIGPVNITVINGINSDTVYSANNSNGEIMSYTIT